MWVKVRVEAWVKVRANPQGNVGEGTCHSTKLSPLINRMFWEDQLLNIALLLSKRVFLSYRLRTTAFQRPPLLAKKVTWSCSVSSNI